jgi:iron complex outermembrane receptor protein
VRSRARHVAQGLRGSWPGLPFLFFIMSFLSSVPLAPGVRSAVAVACGVCFGFAVAQPAASVGGDTTLEPVVVSSSRMPELLRSAPIGATVITAEQIQRSGVVDANEAVRKLGGVPGRSDLQGGRDLRLDLRGFGDTADQNLVVLVDGIRISENEQAGARLSSIPLDRIDRIEIVRGGASVLWGEGASAGVINVILKDGARSDGAGRVMAAVESHDGHELLASGERSFGAVTVDGNVRRVRSDGYRENSRLRQDVGSLGVQWREGPWRAGWRVQHEDQAAGLPGYLSADDARRDPRRSDMPNDYSNLGETRHQVQLGWSSRAWSWQVDAGQRSRDVAYQYVGPGSTETQSTSRQSQVAPRVSWHDQVQGADLRLTGGLDWQEWRFDKLSVDGLETGGQHNLARYVHADAGLASGTRLSMGWRSESVSKRGNTPGNLWTSAVQYTRDDDLHAGELGVSQALTKQWSVYVRGSTSYRLANVDENRVTPGQQALKPQRNRDREIGVKWGQGAESATVRYFVQQTRDEIIYVVPLAANANIDPTRRRGVEAEARAQVLPGVNLIASVQQLTARYTEGVNAGKSMIHVSPRSATLRASWRVNDHHSIEVGAQYLSSARYGGDEANACSIRVPASTLIDARYAWKQSDWTVAVSGQNLTDRQGWNYGYSSACGMPSVYPYAGRSWRLSASRAF